MPARIVFSAETEKLIAKLYEDGFNSTQIASELLVSQSKILSTLRELQIPMRPPNNQKRLTICIVIDCDSPAKAKEFCDKHYQRFRNHGDPQKLLIGNQICSVSGCERKYYGAGYCLSHYDRVRRSGDPRAELPIGPKVRTKQSITKSGKGYLRIYFSDGTFMAHHRYIMEQKLNRKLLAGENVHHLNGIKSDNRPENLELWTTHQPPKQRVNDLRKWAQEILKLYPEDT